MSTLDLSAFIFCVGDVLPNKFVQIYESMNEEMKEGIRTGRLESMTPENFAKVSTSLFLLIPVSTKFHTITIPNVTALMQLILSSC